MYLPTGSNLSPQAISPRDADHAHHPAGKSPFYAVGEKAICVAAGALPGEKDCPFREPGGEQLPPVRLGQIQVHAGTDVRCGRAHGQ